MYGVVDDRGRIIALHDEKEVVEKYVEAVYMYHKINLDIIKIKKKSVKNIKDYDDLYLVRYGSTYVQAGYLVYIQLENGQILDDLRYAKDILLRTLEINKLNKGDRKSVSKAIKVFNKILDDEQKYTPSREELERLKNDLDPYIYNYGRCIE